MRYSGREFTDQEIRWITEQIAADKEISRTIVSRRFCEQFNWKKPDGSLKDVSCRVALLRMEADGLFVLPPRKKHVRPPRFPVKRTLFGEPQPEQRLMAGDVSLSLEQVDKRSASLWNELIDRYHYLGYITLPGAQLRYFIIGNGEIIGCPGFSASAWSTAARDRFIGWSSEQRKRGLHLIVNNSRFLILPWIISTNPGSRILSMVHRQLPRDWQDRYHVRPVLLETFVERDRFCGTVYKASNWLCVGETTGLGKKCRTRRAEKPIKTVWLFPLHRRFRDILLFPAVDHVYSKRR